MEINIPKEFLTITRVAGLKDNQATEFFYLKIRKKGTDGLKVRLVNDGVCESFEKAQSVLSTIWKEYQRNQYGQTTDIPNHNAIPAAVRTGHDIQNYKTYLQEAKLELEKAIGRFEIPPYTPRCVKAKNRVAVISDLHIPFVNPKALGRVFEDPAEELWIVGDLLDMYAVSKYRKNIDHITVRDELAQGRAFLEQCVKKFARIKLLKSSNHPDRAARRLQETMPQILPLLVNPMDLLANGLPIEVVSTRVFGTAPTVEYGEDLELGWVAQYGNCILSHMENFCTATGVNQVNTWIQQWNHVLKLRPYQMIFHAHTHNLGIHYTPDGKALVNTGCLCKPMEYMFDGHGKFNPPTNGYVAFNMENNVADLRSLELICVP